MSRHHNINGVSVPFTEAEEAEKDAVEAAWVEGKAIRNAEHVRVDELEAKLADDSITFEEMKELMRLRG